MTQDSTQQDSTQQDYTPDTLLAEEQAALVLPTFDLDRAWALGCRLRQLAAERGAPVAIEVTHGAEPAFFTLLPGASPDNRAWVERKRRVVTRFLHASLYLRLLCERDGVDFNARYRLPSEQYVASGGGVPIFVRGSGLAGVASVSGLPDVEDHRLVVRGLAELGAT